MAVIAHAVFGAVALAAGVVAFERPPRAITTYLAALVLMLGFLVAAIALEWTALDTTTRVLFVALGVVGAVVLGRGIEAQQRRPEGGRRPAREYRQALGFTIIALTDAFLIIAVLDLGAPTWAVVSTGVLVAALGHFAVRSRITSLHSDAPAPAPTNAPSR